MTDLDQQVIASRSDDRKLESLVKQMEQFILHSVFRVTHQFSTVHDDEYSIALEAFIESVHSFDPEKGSFLSFAYLVIRRRVIDHLKRSRYKQHEYLVDPYLFTGEKQESDESESAKFFGDVPVQTDDFSLQWEILSLKEALYEQRITYQDLEKCSPKSDKTKKACARVIVYILKNSQMLYMVKEQNSVPLKSLENLLQIPRKTMEAHRKYIIAAIEILTGDYPLLSEYLGPVKEELAQ